VGRRNYRSFLSLLGCIFALTSLQIVSFVHAGTLQLTGDDNSASTLEEVYKGFSAQAHGAVLVVIGALILPLWLMVLQLGTFHAALIWRGLTTYEFIMAQRRKEKIRDQELLARGEGTKLNTRQLTSEWINRNAPCLAVCELCDDTVLPIETRNAEASPVKPCRGCLFLTTQMTTVRRVETVRRAFRTCINTLQSPLPSQLIEYLRSLDGGIGWQEEAI